MAFTRFARSVQRSLDLRARAADRLLARDKAATAEREAGRPARRDRQRVEVEEVLDCMIWDEVEDLARAEALREELEEKVEDLYRDEEVRVEDRPLGSVMAGLACGLGLSEEWQRWRGGCWSAEPHLARPSGDPAAVEVERDRRRAAVTAAVERDFAECAPPDRLAGLRAGLAARLREPDVIEWLDTETVDAIAGRLCRSLGLGFRVYVPDTG